VIATQPAKAGDRFLVDGAIVHVIRCSRDPQKPWVDIYVEQSNGAGWGKRMPAGIPAKWAPYAAVGAR
jgi:hypothetical protein